MIALFKEMVKPLFRYASSPSYREFIRLKSIGRHRRPGSILSFHEFNFEVPDFASFLWQCHDLFVMEHYLVQLSKPNPVILDGGANIGVSCAWFKHFFPQASISAFEPDPRIAAILTRNCERNGFDRIVIHQEALWVETSPRAPFFPDHRDGGSLFGTGEQIRVPTVSLAAAIRECGHVDILKLDIEGAEADVLESCANELTNVHHVLLEYHSLKNRSQGLENILRVLTENGFRYILFHPQTSSFPPRLAPLFDFQVHLRAWKYHR